MTLRVAQGTNNLRQSINTAERRLSILKSQYYDYAVRWQIELQFGSTAKSVFEEYQERVDGYYSQLPTTTLQKLNAIEELLEDGNPERYAQVLTSCRRLWSETAKTLFVEILPNYSGNTYKTKSGREIDISGDHDNNKLSAVIEEALDAERYHDNPSLNLTYNFTIRPYSYLENHLFFGVVL